MKCEIIKRSKNNLTVLIITICISLLFCGSTFSQISVEFNGVGGKPFGSFGENINRDGYFGINLGLFYKPKKFNYLSLGLQFSHLPYDESTFSDLQFEDNLYIRQRFKTKVGMQTFHAVIRAHLIKQNKLVNPYIDAILGLNRFYGVTRSDDAFFTDDTNMDGIINDDDGEINPIDLGITTSVELANSSTKFDHNSISPTIGLGFGLQINVIKSLKFDTRIAYLHGFRTTYYDYGSQDINTNSIENFVLVESITPVFFWTMGLNYTFQ